MSSHISQLPASFGQMRSFLLNDVERMMHLQPGVNYAAILVIMSACELLGRLRYGRKDGGPKFFGQYMLPCRWAAIAPDLFNALRNGLVHSYDTKAIVQVGKRKIEVVVSWQEKKHLAFDEERHHLFVNVHTLVDDLRSALDRYGQELKAELTLLHRYDAWCKKDRQVHVIDRHRQAVWREILEDGGEKAG